LYTSTLKEALLAEAEAHQAQQNRKDPDRKGHPDEGVNRGGNRDGQGPQDEGTQDRHGHADDGYLGPTAVDHGDQLVPTAAAGLGIVNVQGSADDAPFHDTLLISMDTMLVQYTLAAYFELTSPFFPIIENFVTSVT
jgi:hypothetical protein